MNRDIQLEFDFPGLNDKVEFITVKGTCSCGYEYTYRRAAIVSEMTVRCPECSALIKIK